MSERTKQIIISVGVLLLICAGIYYVIPEGWVGKQVYEIAKPHVATSDTAKWYCRWYEAKTAYIATKNTIKELMKEGKEALAKYNAQQKVTDAEFIKKMRTEKMGSRNYETWVYLNNEEPTTRVGVSAAARSRGDVVRINGNEIELKYKPVYIDIPGDAQWINVEMVKDTDNDGIALMLFPQFTAMKLDRKAIELGKAMMVQMDKQRERKSKEGIAIILDPGQLLAEVPAEPGIGCASAKSWENMVKEYSAQKIEMGNQIDMEIARNRPQIKQFVHETGRAVLEGHKAAGTAIPERAKDAAERMQEVQRQLPHEFKNR